MRAPRSASRSPSSSSIALSARSLSLPLLVVRVAGPVIEWMVRLAERITDPVVSAVLRRRTVRASTDA